VVNKCKSYGQFTPSLSAAAFASLTAAQIDIIGNNWLVTSQAQKMADLAGTGRLDLSVFEHKRFALDDINSALASNSDRNGGFSNRVVIP
jgi:D-arabinose 1-dehydrogenase-like Zn-dependent alcohol dehydrogenase